MSDHLLADFGKSYTGILDRNLGLQRKTLMAGALLGGISAFPALPYLFSHPAYPFYDSLLQLCNGIILLFATLALITFPVSYTRRIALVSVSLVMLDMTIRVILAHHGPAVVDGLASNEIINQFASMMPAVLIGCFLFLDARHAITLCWLQTTITATSVLIYQISIGDDAWNDFGNLGVALQFIFAHPVIIILLTMISRLNSEFQKYSEYALLRSSEIESELLRDETGELLTRPAILKIIKNKLETMNYEGRIIQAKFELEEHINDQKVAELRNNLCTIMKNALPESADVGLIESNQLIAVYSEDTDFSSEDALIHTQWRQKSNIELNLYTQKMCTGMTWAILSKDMELPD